MPYPDYTLEEIETWREPAARWSFGDEAAAARMRQEEEERRRIVRVKLQPLGELAKQAASELSKRLNARAVKLGQLNRRFNIAAPEIPELWTEEHLEALQTIFGGHLEPLVLPRPEELHNLDDRYAAVMYPPQDPTRQAQDAKEHQGLISFRPSWFEQKASSWGIGNFDAKTTKGQAYLRSMSQELQTLGGSLILIETTQKPDYKDGTQHYGAKEGTDAAKDPLLPIFQEAFGLGANRFSHSWDELTAKLLLKVKKKITAALKSAKLPVPNFEVILAPASALNLQTTLFHPENSQTNTWEWTSTLLTDKDGQDTGRRLVAGHSEDGGAAGVESSHRGAHWDVGGARLAVMLKKT